jgi:hypothetical protein
VVKSFILGAVTGGAVVWFWGREIRELVEDKTLGMREAVADRLQSAAGGLQGTADRLQRAKETIESGLGGA